MVAPPQHITSTALLCAGSVANLRTMRPGAGVLENICRGNDPRDQDNRAETHPQFQPLLQYDAGA